MRSRFASIFLFALLGCGSSRAAESVAYARAAEVDDGEGALKTVIDLRDLKMMPDAYEWFEFRPQVKKLILAGAAEGKHVAILWYTTADGGVGLHYHAKTESVYVIDGTQTDAKGVYPTGSIYFNPPGSGHQITRSSGFFILAYASPPNFSNTAAIGEYTPLRIDTAAKELTSTYAFAKQSDGVFVYALPLDASGGMKAQLMELKPAAATTYSGNYVLVLRGSCVVDGITHGPSKLVVAKGVEPQRYELASAANSSSCVTLGVSF